MTEFVLGEYGVTYKFVDGFAHTFTLQTPGEDSSPPMEKILKLR